MTSALAPPPMSRKLAADPPTWLTTSSVLMARPAPLAMMPDRAVEADVVEPLLLGQPLALVELLGAGELLPLGVAEGGVVVEGHLGVEGVDPAVGREDQRVDLDQVAVALDVAAVQLHRAPRPPASRASASSPASSTSRGGGLGRQPVDRVDVQPGDGARGRSAATSSMSTPPLRRHHAQVQLGRPVEGEAGVVLPVDVRGVLDPQPVHHVALDVHAEDGAGVACAPRRRRRPA